MEQIGMVRCNLILSYTNVGRPCVNDSGCQASVWNDSPSGLFTQQVPKGRSLESPGQQWAPCSTSQVAPKEWRWVGPPEDGFINSCVETMSKSKLVPTGALPTSQLKLGLGVRLYIQNLKFSTAQQISCGLGNMGAGSLMEMMTLGRRREIILLRCKWILNRRQACK